jgi:hypothetical protein
LVWDNLVHPPDKFFTANPKHNTAYALWSPASQG